MSFWSTEEKKLCLVRAVTTSGKSFSWTALTDV